MNLKIRNSKMVPSTVSQRASIAASHSHFRIITVSEMFSFYVSLVKCKISPRKCKISPSCSCLKRIVFGLDVGCPVWFDTWRTKKHQGMNCVVHLRPQRKGPTSELRLTKAELHRVLSNKCLHQDNQHSDLHQNLKHSDENEYPTRFLGQHQDLPTNTYSSSLYQMRHCLPAPIKCFNFQLLRYKKRPKHTFSTLNNWKLDTY